MRVVLFFLLFASCSALADKDYDELKEALGVEETNEQVILICSCKKPAFIIDEEGVWVYHYEDYTPHINEMVLKSCAGDGELPNTKTYDTSRAKKHACPVNI